MTIEIQKMFRSNVSIWEFIELLHACVEKLQGIMIENVKGPLAKTIAVDGRIWITNVGS